MNLYCANCGLRLPLIRKAIPILGMIVEVIPYHECPEKMSEFHPKHEMNAIASPVEGKDKFVQLLNDLKPLKRVNPLPFEPIHTTEKQARNLGTVSTFELRDRRFEADDTPVKSTAPSDVLRMIREMSPTEPANSIDDLEPGKDD